MATKYYRYNRTVRKAHSLGDAVRVIKTAEPHVTPEQIKEVDVHQYIRQLEGQIHELLTKAQSDQRRLAELVAAYNRSKAQLENMRSSKQY